MPRTIKRLPHKQERQLLYECVACGRGYGLVHQYWNLVYHTVRKTLIIKGVPFTDEDIKDLRNEVFVRLFDKECRRLRQYREGRGNGLSGWISLIACRTVLNYLRKKGFDSLTWQRCRIPIEGKLQLKQEKPDLETVEEERQLIQDALKRLPSRDRLVLTLHYHYDLSLPEVASSIRRTLGATYTIKSRAIKRLKVLISGN
jgi:RNA polymerase sigma factor (sigma-70 family)